MAVKTFIWEPGRRPAAGTAVPEGAPTGTFLWVDAEHCTTTALVAAVQPLNLNGMRPQMLWHLMSNVSPDDPVAADLYEGDDYDPAVAAQLLSGQREKLLQTFRPEFVVFIGSRPRRSSYVTARVGMLASVAGWLVTYRAAPLDLRFAGYEGPQPASRSSLIDAAHGFHRTDQLPGDVATLMRRWLALEAVRVSDEIDDEISRRLHDVHEILVGDDRDGPLPADEEDERFAATRRELFDLRWVIDSHHISCRRQDPQRSPQVSTFDSGSRDPDVVQDITGLYRQAATQSAASRAGMQEALGWLTTEQASQNARRSERLQRLVGALSVFVLGPTLVATIFGAQDSWFDDHAELRTALMFALMITTSAVGAFFVGLAFGPVPDRPIDQRPPNEPRPFTLRWYGWVARWCAEELMIGWHIATGRRAHASDDESNSAVAHDDALS